MENINQSLPTATTEKGTKSEWIKPELFEQQFIDTLGASGTGTDGGTFS